MPNYVTNTSNRIKNPIYKNWWFLAIVGVVLLAGILITIKVSSNNNRSNYIENVNKASLSMLSGAAEAEAVCNLTRSVWYNTIYEKYSSETDKYTKSAGYGFNDDFNTSLSALYSDDNVTSMVDKIEENRELVATIMKSLTNQPKDLQMYFDLINDMYSAYYNLTELAVNPSGSLTTFSDDVSKYDGEFMELYNRLELYMPEGKE